MQTHLLTKEVFPQLETFFDTAKELKYLNNVSKRAMKYDWCLDFGGIWHCAIDDNNRMVSLAGCHPLPEVDDNAWRVMFRGVQIPGDYGFGLSKYHMSALTWRLLLPLQLEYIDNADAYITTNISHDASGKMNKTHRLFQQLEKLGMVEHYNDMELYHTDQSVWKLNKEKYMEVRSNVV
jgi:hypothetical protein